MSQPKSKLSPPSRFKMPKSTKPEQDKNNPNSRMSDISEKLRNKFDLKSSIPKPTKMPERMPSKSLSPNRSPVSSPRCWSAGREPTLSSIVSSPLSKNHSRSVAKSEKCGPRLQSPSVLTDKSDKSKLPLQPKSAIPAPLKKSILYTNAKTKVNSNPFAQSKSHDLSSRTNTPSLKSRETSFSSDYAAVEKKHLSKEEESKKQILYNELRTVESPDGTVGSGTEPNKVDGKEGSEKDKSLYITENSPEFLVKFEKDICDISMSWLRLMCDIIATKLVMGSNAMSRLSIPDSDLDPREELMMFFNSLPNDGNPMQSKLLSIEEDHKRAVGWLMHDAVDLWKSHKDLKDEYWRLHKTQDQIHKKLEEEMAILNAENKALDNKLVVAAEKYNCERARTEQQERQKIQISKDIAELRKRLKYLDGRCVEWQTNLRRAEGEIRSLETQVRTTNNAIEKETKLNRELTKKAHEAQEVIRNLEKELTRSRENNNAMEMMNKQMQSELTNVKASLDDSQDKRNKLVDELTNKTKKMNELEAELELLRTYMTANTSPVMKNTQCEKSNVLIEDLTKDLSHRNLQIQELKKKLKEAESIVREKKQREDLLIQKLSELQKKPLENDVALQAQITELQYMVKDLTEEKSELEKIVLQKTLELDQRDLLLKQTQQAAEARDKFIPTMANKQSRQGDCFERLKTVVMEHQKTYYAPENIGQYYTDGENDYTQMPNQSCFAFQPNPLYMGMEGDPLFREEHLTQVYGLLEQKQVEMMRLERRVRDLQKAQEERAVVEREREEQLAALRRAMGERRNKQSRGFMSLFSS